MIYKSILSHQWFHRTLNIDFQYRVNPGCLDGGQTSHWESLQNFQMEIFVPNRPFNKESCILLFFLII